LVGYWRIRQSGCLSLSWPQHRRVAIQLATDPFH